MVVNPHRYVDDDDTPRPLFDRDTLLASLATTAAIDRVAFDGQLTETEWRKAVDHWYRLAPIARIFTTDAALYEVISRDILRRRCEETHDVIIGGCYTETD
jgi:hypothetical protein